MEAEEFNNKITRLKEEQKHALQNTDEQIRKWQGFKSDYEALKQRLTTLPDQVSHDVMVPFGKMAFMPGKLVHTNEILVLLGDNWFAERSAKQAVGIVNRRMKQIDGQLKDLDKQRKLLEPRLDFTSELQHLGNDGKDTFEIREEYDEEKEKQWKEEHRERVKKHRQKIKGSDTYNAGVAHDRTNIDEKLWARLDELEQIESTGNEMERLGEEEDTQQTLQYPWKHEKFSDNTFSHELYKDKNHIDIVQDIEERLNIDNQEVSDSSGTLSELDSDDEESLSEKGDSGSDEIVTGGKVIHFTHTVCNRENSTTSASKSQEIIQHPGDVYNKFLANRQPKSILKKTSSEPKKVLKKKVRKRVVDFDTGSDTDEKYRNKQSVKQIPNTPAFTGMVVEKPVSITAKPTVQSDPIVDRPAMIVSGQSSKLGAQSSELTETAKPVSRFKARRQNKSET